MEKYTPLDYTSITAAELRSLNATSMANEKKWFAHENVKEVREYELGEGVKLEAMYPLEPEDSPARAGPRSLVIFFPDTQHYLPSIESFAGLSKQLAHSLDSVLVTVQTRLSPEVKYPIPVDDAVSALEFLFGEEGLNWLGSDLVDRSRVFLISVGSGCSLAMGAWQRIHDKLEEALVGKVFIMPQFNPSCHFDSYTR
jgi:acetyl esterase/lipase